MNKELQNALKDVNELYELVLTEYKKNTNRTELVSSLTDIIIRRISLIDIGFCHCYENVKES